MDLGSEIWFLINLGYGQCPIQVKFFAYIPSSESFKVPGVTLSALITCGIGFTKSSFQKSLICAGLYCVTAEWCV